MIFLILLIFSAHGNENRNGWSCTAESCYLKLRLRTFENFEDALRTCQEKDGELAAINSLEEHQVVHELCGAETCWIGFARIKDQLGQKSWHAIDGSVQSTVYSNWDNYTEIASNAAVIARDGKWRKLDATAPDSQTIRDFICEKSNKECGSGSTCEYYVHKISGNFDTRRLQCQEIYSGGDLAVLRSADDNERAHSICPEHENCYFGLYNQDPNQNWKWVDGSPVNYTNWNEHATEDIDEMHWFSHFDNWAGFSNWDDSEWHTLGRTEAEWDDNSLTICASQDCFCENKLAIEAACKQSFCPIGTFRNPFNRCLCQNIMGWYCSILMEEDIGPGLYWDGSYVPECKLPSNWQCGHGNFCPEGFYRSYRNPCKCVMKLETGSKYCTLGGDSWNDENEEEIYCYDWDWDDDDGSCSFCRFGVVLLIIVGVFVSIIIVIVTISWWCCCVLPRRRNLQLSTNSSNVIHIHQPQPPNPSFIQMQAILEQCPHCSSHSLATMHTLSDLTRLHAGYGNGYWCTVCEDRQFKFLFPMKHCASCNYDRCPVHDFPQNANIGTSIEGEPSMNAQFSAAHNHGYGFQN